MPSGKGAVVIGVGLDGVCADFYGRMRVIAAEWLEVDVSTLTTSPTYGLKEWGIEDYKASAVIEVEPPGTVLPCSK